MRRFWFAVAASALLVPAGSTLAASLISTPALRRPAGGSLECTVSNVSATRSLQFVQTILGSNGSAAFGPDTATFGPNESASAEEFTVSLGRCSVEVVSGSKKDVRVVLAALDATGRQIAVVSGQ